MGVDVSIIVPVYNRQNVVEETILSVIAQTFTNWELILIDDHSTDNSLNVCFEFSRKDNRIKVFSRESEKKGASVCRNQGLKIALGKYIIFLDSDDLLAPFCLQQRVEVMTSNNEIDFAIFPMLLFNETPNDLMLLQNIDTGADVLNRFLNRDMVWVISGPIWRRESLLGIGGLNEDLLGFQDMELNVKALANDLKYKMFLDSIPDNFYRQDKKGTISINRDNPEHYTSQTNLVKLLTNLLDSTNKLDSTRKLLLANFLLHIAVSWRYHLSNKLVDSYSQANKTWKLALESKLITQKQYDVAQKYIKFKFNMKYNRIKWLQNKIEQKYQCHRIPELIWKRGLTQSKIIYKGNLQL